MNTSMTINATAAWLLGLYIANAEDHGRRPRRPAGHHPERHRQGVPVAGGPTSSRPSPSLRLTVDTIAYTVRHVPRWNPINVCSYHLQEAGATPVQEVAYALATAIGVLDAVRDSGKVADDELPPVVGRISFFVNAGVRFVEETCKMRAFTAMWEPDLPRALRGRPTRSCRRFRYGVQVNSLGLTEQQPENNVPRIVLETLGVTLSKRRPGPGHPAPGVERGARAAPPLGPAVVAAHPADPGLRVGPARVRRHLRRARRSSRRRPPSSTEAARAELDDVLGPRGRLRGHRRAEAPPGAQPGRAGPAHRDRRAAGGRGELLHRDGPVAAHRRREAPRAS